jgi:hypothetical protein
MPGTTHRVIDNEPVRQGPAIVGAMGADGEHLRPSAHHQHRLIPHVASEFRAIGEPGERDPLRQIGAAWTCLIFGHSTLLQLPARVHLRSASGHAGASKV